jgi:histone acetyltransferase MYST1
MDEWVGMDRIVSPPSVGNAKARALKKEEERLKRKQQRLEERKRAEQQKKEQRIHEDVSAPRASRRRSSVQQQNVNTNLNNTSSNPSSIATSPAAAVGAGEAAAAALADGSESGDTPARRTTRLQRRKSTTVDGADDAATVVTSNQPADKDEGGDNQDNKSVPAIKEVVTLPIGTSSTSAMTTTTIGEHVVATIAAQELDEHEGLDEASLREHEEITKIKNVSFIELGRHQMETWYFSPIPKELLSQRGYIEVLYVCEFTFRMFARKSELQRFQQRSLKPQHRHPPGNEIYRKGNLSMFEVDGLSEKIYCQNLCYIAKLFLDHKTLYFDVDPFLFYVLCEVDDRGYHPVGYYSKEKYSDVGYNLACILTFPAHQRKGYGRFLIAFSYELSKKQEKVGGPERPVSDLGQKAYKPYWAATVIDFLRETGRNKNGDGNISSSSLSIMDISKKTSIMAEDIVFTLNQLGILKIINGVYFIAAEASLLEKLAKKYPVKEPRVDPSKLHWTPFLTDVKRDKFSIHSKKPNVESFNTVANQQVVSAPAQQQGQTQPQKQ